MAQNLHEKILAYLNKIKNIDITLEDILNETEGIAVRDESDGFGLRIIKWDVRKYGNVPSRFDLDSVMTETEIEEEKARIKLERFKQSTYYQQIVDLIDTKILEHFQKNT